MGRMVKLIIASVQNIYNLIDLEEYNINRIVLSAYCPLSQNPTRFEWAGICGRKKSEVYQFNIN